MKAVRDAQLDAALGPHLAGVKKMNELSSGTLPVRGSSSWKAIAITSLVAAMVVAGLWYWRTSKAIPSTWAAGPIDVVATTLKMQPAPVRLDAVGELRAVRQATLPAEVPGRVASISFESGHRVEAGAVLVQLDDAIEQADLTAAKANASFARQQLARATELASSGAMSQEILQQRQAERDQTEAVVQQLEARIRQKRIRAPFAGELGLRRIDPGQYLNAGDSAVTLTDLDRLYANFDVPQQDLGRIHIGQQVDVNVGSADASPVQATISAIEPQVGRDTRNASIQAVLPNAEHRLRPGMFATITVKMPDEPETLMLPASAIMTSPSGDAVVVVRGLGANKIGKAEFATVTVSRRLGDRVVIANGGKAGVKAGDVVVTEGQVRVQPGAVLHVVNKPADTPAASRVAPIQDGAKA
jgi:multidrug efflux system membrane fusion protein